MISLFGLFFIKDMNVFIKIFLSHIFLSVFSVWSWMGHLTFLDSIQRTKRASYEKHRITQEQETAGCFHHLEAMSS